MTQSDVTPIEFTPETWMFGEDGKLLRDQDFTVAMNAYYRERYAGLSRPIVGEDIWSLQEPEWALKNLIQENGMTMIHGSPGSGKSLLAMDWAYTLAHPALTEWMGQPRSRRFKPMYIFTEGLNGLRVRSTAWQKERGVSIPTGDNGVVWIRDAVRLNRTDDPNEPWSSQVAALFEMFNDYERDILFVDTLANTFGGNENSQQDANNYLATLRMFVNAGAPVVIVHHNTKESDDYRGSTVFEGAVDTKVAVKENTGIVSLYITKQKDGDPGFNLTMRLKIHEWQSNHREMSSVALVEAQEPELKITKKQRELLLLIDAGYSTVEAIAVEAGRTVESTANMLKRMEELGYVSKDKDDRTWSSTLETL